MPQFTPGELAVMRILWEHGELKPADIQRLFSTPIKNPALRSYLTILLEKGHVSRRKVGKAYHYKAITRERSAFRSSLREMVDAYCDGSIKSLVLNLIRAEELSADDLTELKRLADETPPAGTGERQ